MEYFKGPIRFRFSSKNHADDLIVRSFYGVEEINGSHRFQVQLAVPNNTAFLTALEQNLVGHGGLLTINAEAEPSRRIRGHVAALSLLGVDGPRDAALVNVELVSGLWLLSLRTNCRVFQDISIRDIVDGLCEEWQIARSWNLSRSYKPQTYITQYHETDYDFLRRILAYEGIYFYCEHPKGGADQDPQGDRLVFLDHPWFYPFIDDKDGSKPESAPVLEYPGFESTPRENVVTEITTRRAIASEAVRLADFDFRKPMLAIPGFAQVAEAEQSSLGNRLGARALQVYHYADTQEFAYAAHQAEVDDDKAGVALEQARAGALTQEGASYSWRLSPGHKFRLDAHPVEKLNREYVVARVEHFGLAELASPVAPGAHGAQDSYRNRFACVPSDRPLRPALIRRPIRQVSETATVVGAGSESIDTDEFGRVKVQFHWDLHGKRNEHSSCWLRVVQPWAGSGWGAQFIPRVGTEVLVTFLGGDVDCPVVVGCLYNGTHPVPFDLPEHKTRSGLRTHSTAGQGGNELSFEDAPGQEEILVHAERDLNATVTRNHSLTVDENQRVLVRGAQELDVGSGQNSVVRGSAMQSVLGEHTAIVNGALVQAVGGNTDLRTSGDRIERIVGKDSKEVLSSSELAVTEEMTLRVQGHLVTIVGKHDARSSATLHVEGSTAIYSVDDTEIVADKSLSLRCGKSEIRLTPDAIELYAPALQLHSDTFVCDVEEDLKVLTKKTQIYKADKILLKTKGATVALAKEVKIDGDTVKLNCGPDPKDTESPTYDPPKPTKLRLVASDGKPLAEQRFVLVFPDGSERAGFLDKDGSTSLLLEQSGTITFPDVSNPRQG